MISNFQCPSQERVTQVLWYLLFQDSFQTSQCKLKEKKKNQNLFKALPRQFWSHLFCFSSFVSHSLPFITTHKVYSSFPNLNSTRWTLKNVTAFSPACISEIFKNNSQPHCLLLDFFLRTILFTHLETHASSLQLLQLLKQLREDFNLLIKGNGTLWAGLGHLGQGAEQRERSQYSNRNWALWFLLLPSLAFHFFFPCF